ncbi:M24 family metallopeptidase C-terminal domain-containing protein [Mesorhizobium sp. M0751]
MHWLDEYHARALAEIGPMLDGETLAWLEKATACCRTTLPITGLELPRTSTFGVTEQPVSDEVTNAPIVECCEVIRERMLHDG